LSDLYKNKMNTNFSAKGDELYAKAEKKLKGGGGIIGSLFGQSKADRQDEAKELFQQAANCYKMSKNWERAVDSYMRCAQCEPEEADGATYLLEAAHCLKKTSITGFVELAEKAIHAFCMGGRISAAASLSKEVAESLEEEYDYEQAAKFFEKTSELYGMEESTTYANQALVKSSDLHILSRDFSKLPIAIKNYEKVAKKYLTVALIKSSAKDLFFKAALTYLANDDLVGCKRAIDTYSIEDPSFDGSREMKFLVSIMQAVEAKDAGAYQQAVYEFNRMTPFDKVKTQLVAKIKEIYVAEVGDYREGEIDLTGAAKTSNDVPDLT